MSPKSPILVLKACGDCLTRESDKAIADVITMADEAIDDTKPYDIFDPEHVWKRKTVENFLRGTYEG